MSTSSTSPQHPNTNDPEAWQAYWETQDQSWRTEPEIDVERQKYLNECLMVKGIEWERYPFRDIVLSRADVEWLLAMHDRSGPVEQKHGQVPKHTGLDLRGADLRKVDLHSLPLQGSDLYMAYLQGSDLREAHLEQTNLSKAHLEGAYLYNSYLQGAYLSEAYLERANLSEAHLEEADLSEAHLESTNLRAAILEGANLSKAQMQKSDLREAHLERTNLNESHLEGSNLSGAFLNSATNLRGIFLGNQQLGFLYLAGVRWGDVDLSVVDWSQMKMLGDEAQAREQKTANGEVKDFMTRLNEYRTAVRANRQLAVALQAEGLNEEAGHFGYRAQRLQRTVLRQQGKFGQYLFSLFLDLLVGYGYKPGRSLLWYLVFIFGFALAYSTIGHFSPLEAFIFSLTSFHGRGFLPVTNLALTDLRAILAAFEAIVGLVIEASLIATFTQRFFAK